MSNPWDRFPIPKYGEKNEYVLFAGVGEVMTRWESIEFELSMIYNALIGNPSDWRGLQEYGAGGNIFRLRIANMQRKAEEFFLSNPNQHLEAEFDNICELISGFSLRRNEVAHGIVFNAAEILFFKHNFNEAGAKMAKAFLVLPPYHQLRSHKNNGMPDYAYNVDGLSTLCHNLTLAEVMANDFRQNVLAVLQKAQP